MRTFFLLLAFAFPSALCGGTVYQADFARDFSLFKPYRDQAPVLQGGKLYLGSGTQINVPLPRPGRYLVEAQVTGKSRTQMASFGAPATTYTDELENGGLHRLSYYSNRGMLSLCIYTLSDEAFALHSLSVKEIETPQLDEADVPALVFEAEDFPGTNGWTRKEQGSDIIYRSGQRWYRPLRDFPAPRSSKPLYLYVRARSQRGSKMRLALCSDRQALAVTELNTSQFAWFSMGPLTGAALGEALSMQINGEPNVNVDIDRFAWSSNANMRAEELEQLPSQNLEQPLLSAFPIQKPQIDGNLDEGSWQSALQVSPFRLVRENTLAVEQTSFKLGYDENALYLGVKAEESALIPANQRMHEFRNKLQAPNLRSCYGDDVILLLIMRQGQSKMYEFVVNANGVLTCAQSDAPDYWSGRQLYNPQGSKAAAQIGNGYYSVELAIPFEDIGGKAKYDGELRILIGRVEKSRSESSSYAAVELGFHLPENLLPLHFAKQALAGEICTAAEFFPGSNRLPLEGDPMLLLNRLRKDDKVENFVSEEGSFEIAEGGEFIFNSICYEPGSLRPLLQSPPIRLRTVSSQLQFEDVPGLTVSLNGKEIKPGKPLSSGLNKLTVSGDKAETTRFRVGDFSFSVDQTWQKSAQGYSKNLLLEHSLLWPDWCKEGLSIMAGHVQQVLFPPMLPEGHSADDMQFHIELPEGFSFEGASGYYKEYPLSYAMTGKLQRQGQAYIRYSINFLNRRKYVENIPSHHYVAFVIRAPESNNAFETKFYFHTSADSLALSELPNECKVFVLPAEKSALPQKVHVQLWAGWLSSMDDKALQELILRDALACGYNEVGVKNSIGLKYFTLIGFESWNFSLQSFLDQYPDSAQVEFASGKSSKTFVCSTRMQDNDFAAWLAEKLPEWHKRRGSSDIICWDYECPVYTSYLACLCPRCQGRFAAKYDLPADLTSDEIKAKYSKQWIDFMTSQMAGVAAALYKGIKDYNPALEFYIYSGYESEQTKFIYGVDWKKLIAHMDFGGAGYGRPIADIKATVAAVQPKPMIMGVIANPYLVSSRMPPTFTSAAELMRAMCDSSGGILIYNYPTLDARSFSAQALVSRIVAENEQFFAPSQYKIAGDEIARTQGCEAFLRADQDGNLLMVFVNLSRSKTAFSGDFKKRGRIFNCRTGEETTQISGSLVSGDIAVYKLQAN
ncbi:MAG: hypothetical protein GX927_09355 [Lentisphaerae bacterium]|mgnify:CR=1 FL=1|jgi:hypothetical protein|nr:hypothetical protein [Lentisphaerota bacterium]